MLQANDCKAETKCYTASSVKLTLQSNYMPPLCHAPSQTTA